MAGFITAAPRGIEVAYADVGTDATGQTNTSFADIANLSAITFTVADRPVKVELFIPLVQVSSATSVFGARICSADAVTQYAFTEYFPGAAFAEGPLLIARRITTPGTYTMKAQTRVTAGNYGMKPSTYGTPTYLAATSV